MGMKSEVEQAIEAHAAWRKHFRDYLNGRCAFDADSAGANDQCQFGKWLNREGYRLMPSDLHDQIRAAHDEFHRIAGGIVRKVKDKQYDAARLDLAPDGPFNHASEHLSTLLHKATLREPGPPGGRTTGEAAA